MLVKAFGCYVGCNKKVVGCCLGYKMDCNKYYCYSHNHHSLCLECYQELRQDLGIQDSFEYFYSAIKDYVKLTYSLLLGSLIIGLVVPAILLDKIQLFVMGTIIKLFQNANTVTPPNELTYIISSILLLIPLLTQVVRYIRYIKLQDLNEYGIYDFYLKCIQIPNHILNCEKAVIRNATYALFLPDGVAYPTVQRFIKNQTQSRIRDAIASDRISRQLHTITPSTSVFISTTNKTSIDARQSQGFINRPGDKSTIDQQYLS